MKIAFVVLAAVLVFGLVDCRPDLNQDIRLLKLKLAKKNELEKKEKENKRQLGNLLSGVTGLVGGLTSTVTGLLGSLNLTNLGLDTILGGVFDVVRTVARFPSALLELLNLRQICMVAGEVLDGILQTSTISTVLDTVCDVVIGIVETIAKAVGDLIDAILDQLEDLFPLLQCLNINVVLAQITGLLSLLGDDAPDVPAVSELGLCDQIFGDLLSQAGLLGRLLGPILTIVG